MQKDYCPYTRTYINAGTEVLHQGTLVAKRSDLVEPNINGMLSFQLVTRRIKKTTLLRSHSCSITRSLLVAYKLRMRPRCQAVVRLATSSFGCVSTAL